MRFWNAKFTLTQFQPDDGEIHSLSILYIGEPCFFERRGRSVVYNQENKNIVDVGRVSQDSFSMYCRANVLINIGDIVTIESTNYTVISIIMVPKLGTKKSHKEVSLEKA
jgi:hypothetical protein